MSYIVNDIDVISRSGRYAKRLTSMLNKHIKKKAKIKQVETVEKRLETAAKSKQELENAAKQTNDIIEESKAAKAYFGLK